MGLRPEQVAEALGLSLDEISLDEINSSIAP